MVEPGLPALAGREIKGCLRNKLTGNRIENRFARRREDQFGKRLQLRKLRAQLLTSIQAAEHPGDNEQGRCQHMFDRDQVGIDVGGVRNECQLERRKVAVREDIRAALLSSDRRREQHGHAI